MWRFTRKRVVDAETAAWHVENFRWLLRQFGGNGDFAAIKLVLPKPGFFTGDGEQGHALAERIFNRVKDYCGMRGWTSILPKTTTRWRAGSRWRRR